VIDVGNIVPTYILHHPCDSVLVLRASQNVDVVGHQGVGVDSNSVDISGQCKNSRNMLQTIRKLSSQILME
jgi:uncharacterized protein with FMN-binding domain